MQRHTESLCSNARTPSPRSHQPCRVRSRRRHAQEQYGKQPAHHTGQHLLVSRLATYAPLVAVFLLALLMGFAGRVLLPQQQQSLPVAGMMSSVLSQASAASQPAVPHRRRLIALSSPFRVNPLAGQVNHGAPQSMHTHPSVLSALPLPVCQPHCRRVLCHMQRSMATYAEFGQFT